MLCKTYKNKQFYIGLIVLGIISLLFGILFNINLPEERHNLSMFSGMLTGIGGAFLVVGIVRLIKLKISSPEKLKEEEIEKNDERNVLILRKSYSITAVSSLFLFIALIFTFLLLDYMIPAIITIACLYIEIAIFFLSYMRISAKM